MNLLESLPPADAATFMVYARYPSFNLNRNVAEIRGVVNQVQTLFFQRVKDGMKTRKSWVQDLTI